MKRTIPGLAQARRFSSSVTLESSLGLMLWLFAGCCAGTAHASPLFQDTSSTPDPSSASPGSAAPQAAPVDASIEPGSGSGASSAYVFTVVSLMGPDKTELQGRCIHPLKAEPESSYDVFCTYVDQNRQVLWWDGGETVIRPDKIDDPIKEVLSARGVPTVGQDALMGFLMPPPKGVESSDPVPFQVDLTLRAPFETTSEEWRKRIGSSVGKLVTLVAGYPDAPGGSPVPPADAKPIGDASASAEVLDRVQLQLSDLRESVDQVSEATLRNGTVTDNLRVWSIVNMVVGLIIALALMGAGYRWWRGRSAGFAPNVKDVPTESSILKIIRLIGEVEKKVDRLADHQQPDQIEGLVAPSGLKSQLDNVTGDINRVLDAILGNSDSSLVTRLTGLFSRSDEVKVELTSVLSEIRSGNASLKSSFTAVTDPLIALSTDRDRVTEIEGTVTGLRNWLSNELADAEVRRDEGQKLLRDQIAAINSLLGDEHARTVAEKDSLEGRLRDMEKTIRGLKTEIGDAQTLLSVVTSHGTALLRRLGFEGSELGRAVSEGDDVQQLRLSLSSTIDRNPTLLSSVRAASGGGLLLDALGTQPLMQALGELLSRLESISSRQMLTETLLKGFETGWMNRLFRGELIMNTYLDSDETFAALRDWYSRTAATLRDALRDADVHLGRVDLLMAPRGSIQTRFDVDVALAKFDPVRRRVREQLKTSDGFIVDVTAFPFVAAGRSSAGEVIVVNPSRWE